MLARSDGVTMEAVFVGDMTKSCGVFLVGAAHWDSRLGFAGYMYRKLDRQRRYNRWYWAKTHQTIPGMT
jgi:hypothetical protein